MEKFDKTREATPKVKRAETRIPDELLEKEDLSLAAKVILAKVLGLWKNCNKEVFISNERLSKLLGGMTIRTVQRAKLELKELKLIEIVQEEKGKGHLAHIKVAEAKVNAYLGFEYFQEEKKDTPAKKETTPQVNRRPDTRVNNAFPSPDYKPLDWMESDYYKKARKENEMAEKAKREWQPL